MGTRYVWRKDRWVERHLAGPRTQPANQSAHVLSDIAPFATQDGVEITSRSALRDYERSRGVKQVGNDWTGSTKPHWYDAWRADDRRSAIGE